MNIITDVKLILSRYHKLYPIIETYLDSLDSKDYTFDIVYDQPTNNDQHTTLTKIFNYIYHQEVSYNFNMLVVSFITTQVQPAEMLERIKVFLYVVSHDNILLDAYKLIQSQH